jgi:hypothetical protein
MDVKLFSYGYNLSLGIPPLGLAYLNAALKSSGHDSKLALFEDLELEIADATDSATIEHAQIPPWNLLRRAERTETVLNTACSLGLGFFDGRLGDSGMRTDCEDMLGCLDKMADRLSGASVVCISLYPSSIGAGLYIARSLKEKDRDVKVVMGGPAADVFRWVMEPPNMFYSKLKDQAVESGVYGKFVGLLGSSVDYIVHGEGEATLIDVVEAVSSGKPRDDIPQTTVFRSGKCVSNPPRPLLDVDSLPEPDFGGADLTLYSRLSFHLSRGCFNSCRYCDEWVYWGGRLRTRSPQKTAAEIQSQAARYGTKYFIACDSLLNGDKAKLTEFCRLLTESRAGIDYVGNIFLPTVDEALFDRLSESGFTKAFFGVETFNPSILACMGKAQSPDDAQRKIRYCTSTGIKAGLNIILGYPGSTVEAEMETLKRIRGLGGLGTWVGLNVADLRLRSRLLDDPEANGFGFTHSGCLDPKLWSGSSLMHCFIPGTFTYVRNSLTRGQLDGIYEEYMRAGLSIDFDWRLANLGLGGIKSLKRLLPRRMRARLNLAMKRQLAEKFR